MDMNNAVRTIYTEIKRKTAPINEWFNNLLPKPGFLFAILIAAFVALSLVSSTSLLAPFVLLGTIILAYASQIYEHFSKWYKTIWVRANINETFTQKMEATHGLITRSVNLSLRCVADEETPSMILSCAMPLNIRNFDPGIVSIIINSVHYNETCLYVLPIETTEFSINNGRLEVSIPCYMLNPSTFKYIEEIYVKFWACSFCPLTGEYEDLIRLDKDTVNSINKNMVLFQRVLRHVTAGS